MSEDNCNVAPRPKVRTIRSYDLDDIDTSTIKWLLKAEIRKTVRSMEKLREKLGSHYDENRGRARLDSFKRTYRKVGGQDIDLLFTGDER